MLKFYIKMFSTMLLTLTALVCSLNYVSGDSEDPVGLYARRPPYPRNLDEPTCHNLPEYACREKFLDELPFVAEFPKPVHDQIDPRDAVVRPMCNKDGCQRQYYREPHPLQDPLLEFLDYNEQPHVCHGRIHRYPNM